MTETDGWTLKVEVEDTPAHGRDRKTKSYSLVMVPDNTRKKKVTLGTIYRTDNDLEQAGLDLFRKLAGVNWSSSKR